jgi:ATP-binding cassette subfamily B protein RaxB
MNLPPLQFGLSRGLPLLMQSEAAECGLACVAMVAGYHGHDIDLLSLRQRFSLGARGATLKHLVDVGAVLKLASRPVKVELDDLAHLRLPCILHWDMTHFVVLRKVVTAPDGTLRAVHLHDPARGRVKVNAAEVSASFTGIALEMTPAQGFARRVERQRIRIGELVSSAAGLRPALLQILGLALALEVFALLSPLFIQLVVDGPIASADYDMLTVVAIGFAVLMLFQTMIGAFRSWMVIYCSTHLNMQWVANVFTHLLNLPLAFFEKRQLGDVISRFNSINVIQETLSTKFIEAILDGMLALTALAVLLHYSAPLAGVVLLFLLSYGLLRWATFVANRRANEEQLSSKAAEQSLFMESVRGIQAIKLFNQESARHVRWLNALAENINRKIVGQRLSLLFTTSSTMLTGAENIAVVWLGARLVIDHTFSIGMLFAFLAYKSVFSARAYALVDKLQELRMLSLHGERLGDIVLTPREDSDATLEQPSLAGAGTDHMTIELKHVSFRYSDADPWVIRDLSLVIHPGQSLAVVGQSGCGKTTLLKLLIGILIPTEGEILIGGTPLKRFGARRYRELIGTVMQDDQLFAGTVAENISFFDQQQDFARVHACATAASVAADLQAMPMGYASLMGDMGASLSGGQKQRLLLARALYKQPQILFLDEATSHLDMENELTVNESIQQLNLTRVIVAHRRETIATAQRVVELSQGAIVRDFLQTQREDIACG